MDRTTELQRSGAENDFSADPSLVADAERGVVVDLLESPSSAPPNHDTGAAGVDVIPYEYTRTLTNTFCWDDDDQEAGHVMTLIDGGGAEILRLQANAACVSGRVEPGEYTLRIVHDGKSAETLAVFVDVLNGGGSAGLEGGLLKTAGGLLADTMDSIGFAQPALAQSPGETNVNTLLRTKRCPGCRLEFANLADASLAGVDLSGAILAGADLSRANLREARLEGASLVRSTLTAADLTRASLFDADLTRANLRAARLEVANLFRAQLSMADLEGADLVFAKLERADLTRANLVGADMTDADLPRSTLVEANLTNADLEHALLCQANLTGANLTGANLSLAVWTNCHSCLQGSIGQCLQ